MICRALLRALLVLAFAAPAQLAAAQGPASPPSVAAPAPPAALPSLIEEQQGRIDALAKRADGLEADIGADIGNDEKLVDIRLQLEQVGSEIIESGAAFRPRLAQINDRLALIGNPPGEGQPPEPEAVTAERRALVAEKGRMNVLLGTAEQLSVRVDGLTDRIANLRRDLFASLLTRRTPIDMTLIADVERNFAAEARGLGRTVSAWLNFVLRFKLPSVLGACFCALLAAAILLIGGRRMFGRLLERDPALPNPAPLDRLSAAFWSTALPSLAVTVFLGVTWGLFDSFAVLRGDIGAMLRSLFQVVGVVYFLHRLGKMVLAPALPNWRLIPVESHAAQLLVALISVTAVFNGLDVFLASVFRLRGSALSLTVAESFVSTIVTGVLIVMIGLVKPFAQADGAPKRWPAAARFLFFGLGALAILSALAGYIGFARFVARQIVVTGAILGLMYIGLLLARAVAEEGALGRNRFGRQLQRRLRLDETGLDQMALLFSFCINALVLLVGVPLILLQWGFQPGDLQAWAYRIGTGFAVGSFQFSPAALLAGLLVFVFGYFLTRWFQRWLDRSVLERGRVDSGVRNSIRMVIGYAGFALTGLFAISTAGIDLSSLALVAGALSLGIGFGLQNIVSNFVSGLILLVERPFKVGDWIVAGPVTGTVKKISVRATEIETFQRQTVILPNSELINSAVGNWTHRNKLGRVDIRLNVAFGTDMRHVDALLLGIARAHPLVLKNPEPQVLFLNFGAAAFEMEVRVFIADILNQNAVQNDIRFAIFDAFRREDIQMVSAPRAAVEAALPEEAAAPPAEAGPERKSDAVSQRFPRKGAARD